MIKIITDFMPYIASAGAGAFSYFLTSKLRTANLNKIRVETEAGWQAIYQNIIEDLKKEMGEMKEEIFMLRKIVESYKNTCDNCPQRLIKK